MKKVIITQSALHFLTGSEVATLEFADFFQNHGMEVVVFTWYLADPMKQEFVKKHIKVTDDGNDPVLDDADYVWVHHQVLPGRILNNLAKSKKQPQFIFLHMSAHKEVSIEQNYIYDLERRLSSKSLFVAEETLDFAKANYLDFDKLKNTSIFPNPVPDEFLSICQKDGRLQTALIVSNHSTEEISEARQILAKKGIKTELLGKNGDAKLADRKTLEKYDLVISIGKTVQYCLCMGLPVYVYDKFGGPGYLTKANLEQAAYANFSGRGFSKKTPQKIAQEIIEEYKSALDFQTKNQPAFTEKYSLKNNVEKVFADLPKTKIEPFSKQYLNYVESIEKLVHDKIFVDHTLDATEKECRKLKKELSSVNNSRAVRLIKKIHRMV